VFLPEAVLVKLRDRLQWQKLKAANLSKANFRHPGITQVFLGTRLTCENWQLYWCLVWSLVGLVFVSVLKHAGLGL